ncbi:sensor domain-containing diguanylate cyclase [Mesobacillus subterraneus]|nr:PAS domain S-box protein [Mesobacillus subterraneus]
MTVKESTPDFAPADIAKNTLAPYFVCIHKDSIILSIDDGGAQLLGFKDPSELIGKSIFSFLHETDQEMVAGRINTIKQGIEMPATIMKFSINGVPMDLQVKSMNTVFNGESSVKTSLRFITPFDRGDKNQDQHGSLILNANKGIIITNPGGMILTVSDSFSRVTGFAKENVVGNNPRMWKSQSYTLTFYKRMWESITSKGYWEGELWNKKRDGSHYLMKVNIYSILNREGHLAHYLAVYTDISEVQKLSNQLKEREEQYRTLVELAPNAILLSQFNRIIYANPPAESLFGVMSQEIIGQPMTAFFKEYPNIASKIDLSDKTVISFEEKLQKDRGQIDVEVSTSLIPYQGHEAVLTVIKEITKRKNMERALRESEEQYRFIAENSSDMIGRLSSAGIILYISPASKRILGYRNEDLIGTKIYEMLHPDDRKTLLGEYGDPQNFRSIVTFSYRMLHKNGEYIWAETTVRPLRDKSGKPSGMMFSTRDITARRTIENQLRESNLLLKKLSSLDGLTEIYNRRAFDEFLKTEWTFARKQETPITLLLMDIDFFKEYNDSYGHIQGDECLKAVARTLEDFFHERGYFAARYGGEEFAVVLPNTDSDKAFMLVEEFMLEIHALNLQHELSPVSDNVTISVGLSSMTPAGEVKIKKIMEFADRALYKAKQSGRNRIEISKRL